MVCLFWYVATMAMWPNPQKFGLHDQLSYSVPWHDTWHDTWYDTWHDTTWHDKTYLVCTWMNDWLNEWMNEWSWMYELNNKFCPPPNSHVHFILNRMIQMITKWGIFPWSHKMMHVTKWSKYHVTVLCSHSNQLKPMKWTDLFCDISELYHS